MHIFWLFFPIFLIPLISFSAGFPSAVRRRFFPSFFVRPRRPQSLSLKSASDIDNKNFHIVSSYPFQFPQFPLSCITQLFLMIRLWCWRVISLNRIPLGFFFPAQQSYFLVFAFLFFSFCPSAFVPFLLLLLFFSAWQSHLRGCLG